MLPKHSSKTWPELQQLININKKSKLYELDITAVQHGHTIVCRDITGTYCVYSKHSFNNRRN
jgi:hypothetical protein